MEIKIPKEVRDYHENIFFGLNTRQFICSVLAVGVAVGIYFALQPYVGTEEIGWMCICLLYTSPSPRDGLLSRMPSSA